MSTVAEGHCAPSPAPGGLGAAAFFDVDNTMMRGASIFHVARKMHQRKVFRLRDAAAFGIKQVRYSLWGESLADVHSIRDTALSLMAGIRVADVETLGEEVYDEMLVSKIWPGTRDLALRHLAEGRQVWLVTATPIEVASVIATRLGLTGALGTVCEMADGAYTGRLVGEILHGRAKADAVADLAGRRGVDLSRSYAYSDSYHDVPLLSTVGHPVAINPDRRLREHASDRNWPVRDYRGGRRAAAFGLRAATGAGIVYGGWRGLRRLRSRR